MNHQQEDKVKHLTKIFNPRTKSIKEIDEYVVFVSIPNENIPDEQEIVTKGILSLGVTQGLVQFNHPEYYSLAFSIGPSGKIEGFEYRLYHG